MGVESFDRAASPHVGPVLDLGATPNTSTMTDVEVAWVAGVIEGEGSFGLKRTSPKVSVQMTDQDVIQRLKAVTGVGNVYACCTQKPHHKPSWLWAVQKGADAAWLIEQVLPWLGDRRSARAKEVLGSWYARSK